jgi:eukaryotic-like serine/threonine-protein kinase
MALSTVARDTAEGRAFLQARIALFARVIFFLDFGFYLLIRAIELAAGVFRPGNVLVPSELAHLASCVPLAAMWFFCRRGQRSASTLEQIDAIGFVAVGVLFGLMGATMPMAFPAAVPIPMGAGFASLVMIAAFTNTAIARAVLVPSTPRRTLWIVLAATAPILAAIVYVQLDSGYGTLLHQVLGMIQFAAYAALPVVVATVTSRVIYGLRKEVREASQLGQYTLEEKIGEGGMGVVYRARHAMLRRPTAIKLLPPERAGENNIARFEREVQLTSKLTHPNTVAIHDYGRTPDGIFYYAMEFLDGVDLELLVEVQGAQPPGRVVHILAQVCGALAEAHGVGLIHRDIKPANIILCERGGVPDVAKVLDFGLVKERDAGADGDPVLSTVNAITGTPLYISPDAIRDPGCIDARSDLYAVGAVGYFLLTGSPVFRSTSAVELCGHHLYSEPEPPAVRLGQALPPELCHLLVRCLAKQPDQRPQSAADLRAELLACPVEPWTDAQAAAWWRQHGTAVQARRTASPVEPYAATVAVDLGRRRARATPAAGL